MMRNGKDSGRTGSDSICKCRVSIEHKISQDPEGLAACFSEDQQLYLREKA